MAKALAKTKTDTSGFAQVEPAHGLGPLFKSVPEGPRLFRTDRQVIEREVGAIEWAGPELGVAEQDCLLGLLAAISGARPTSEAGRRGLVATVQDGHLGPRAPAVSIETTWDEIGSAMGKKEHDSRETAARRAMHFLGSTTARMITPDGTTSWKVLLVNHREEGGRVIVDLNPALAAVAAGGRRAVVPLAERNKFGEAGRLVHAWLCAWIGPGDRREIGLDALAIHVWGKAGSEGTKRWRRRQLREVLRDIKELGWGVESFVLKEGTPGVKITRPLLPKGALPARGDEVKHIAALVAAILIGVAVAAAVVALAGHGGAGTVVPLLRIFVQRVGEGLRTRAGG